MLETLISSRIRRALFEYILRHAGERFYLRGVAKELSLSISPLRRELKRLEQVGMLRTAQEGNMLFYTVDTESPLFHQLQQATLTSPHQSDISLTGTETTAPSPTASYLAGTGRMGLPARAAAEEFLSSRAPQLVASTVSASSSVSVAEDKNISPAPISASNVLSDPLSPPALVGVATIGLGLMMIMTSLFYLRMTNQRTASHALPSRSIQRSEVAIVVSPRASSNAMHSTRWRVIPGGFGGFSSGASTKESY